MKPFKHFNDNDCCFLCGTNEDKPCVLIPIVGTGDNKICEANAIHADCFVEHCQRFRIDKRLGEHTVMYAWAHEDYEKWCAERLSERDL